MTLLQDHTRQLLERTLNGNAHGILLTGPTGAGKGYVARYFAQAKLGLESPEKLEAYPYLEIVTPTNSSISIDQIRTLQKFLQLKTPGTDNVRRLALIEDAHLMTSEAQNALLKSLEEPPVDTVLILTAPATLQLKKTIYSRVQQVPVLPVSKDQAVEYFKDNFDPSAIEKAYAISHGYAGLLQALLQKADHPLLEQIQLAKQILAAPTFERLIKVDELSKQKDSLPLFLYACKLICSTALQQTVAKANTKQTKHWHRALNAVYQAEAVLSHSPNTKLLLTDLFLQL